MIEPCCDVKLKHSRYNGTETAKPKRPCCSKVFENFKSPKSNKNVKRKTQCSCKKGRKAHCKGKKKTSR